MPELPEVETICRSLSRLILDKQIVDVIINRSHLRYPIPPQLKALLCGTKFIKILRRGKYLLFFTTKGIMLVHLGMSGKLLVSPQNEPSPKHEHVVLIFADGLTLRFIDPRRFGAVLWIVNAPNLHPLLNKLGIEPLSREFTGTYLYEAIQKRHITIKQLLMDAKIVVGVGNIYANEALFLSGIKPQRPSISLSKEECKKLVASA